MGWTFTTANHYKGNRVDRLKECEDLLTCSNKTTDWKPLKIALVGSTVYAAVQITTATSKKVYAAVILTKTDMKSFYNFGYKDMDETMCPCEHKCPVSILDLLTPTDNENANIWRSACYKNAEECRIQKRNPDNLNNLPVGSVIEFEFNEKTVRTTKIQHPAYKKPIWYDGIRYRYPQTLIQKRTYKVIERGAKF